MEGYLCALAVVNTRGGCTEGIAPLRVRVRGRRFFRFFRVGGQLTEN